MPEDAESPGPPAIPEAPLPGLPDAPDDALLDLMRARAQGPATQPKWTDTQLKTVTEQCRNRLAVAASLLAADGSQRCDTLPIFVPGGDAPGPATNDLEAIKSNPAWVLLHRVQRSSKNAEGWYDTAAYQPNACELRGALHCDEYPFLSSAEGGPDHVRAAGSPRPRLAPTDPHENRSVEGVRLNAMYNVCRVASGATPTDQSTPRSAYLVIPIPGEVLGVTVPTGFVC